MWPLVRPGARVELRPVAGPLSPGDLIAVEVDTRLVLHRFVRVDDAGLLVLRGDSHRAEDPPVSPEAVVGRVPNLVLGLHEVPRSAWAAKVLRPIVGRVVPPLASRLVDRGARARQSVRRLLRSRMLRSR